MKHYFLLFATMFAHTFHASQVKKKIIDERLTQELHNVIHFAVPDNHLVEEIKELFSGEKIPNINSGKEVYGKRTPLIKAVGYGLLESARLLISLGANVNMQDRNGETALIVTCRELEIPSTALPLINLLIANGTDEGIVSLNGCNAFTFEEPLRLAEVQSALEKRQKKCAEYKQKIANPILENTNLIGDLAHIIVSYVCAEIPREIMPDVPQEEA
jgi:hypothetical protein